MSFQAVETALAEIAAGRMVILVDDEDRENEGDLCMAAQKVTPEAINFMVRYARGLVCLTLTEARLQQLNLPMMVQNNKSAMGTAFTVSIEASRGVTTGISAADRATTILAATAPDANPDDLVSPGHIFPLRAQPGGVLVRMGQTEGSVDLVKLAGFEPAGVICEIMKDDGEMARLPELEVFSKQHGIPIVSIADLIEYRLAHEMLVQRLVSRSLLHPRFGHLTTHVYGTTVNEKQHLAVVKGDLTAAQSPLVCIQTGAALSGTLGDLFNADKHDLDAVLTHLESEDCGVVIFLDHGTTVSLADRILQQRGQPSALTHESMHPELGVGAQILKHLGLSRLRILSNQQKCLKGLSGCGLIVDEMRSFESSPAATICFAQ
jgi:3,4-dihydroxy 2-butanone 4-phosphate synthase / GTP cyclohydrolase II